MSDNEFTETVRETPIDGHVIETVDERASVGFDKLADALVVLDAELRGHHSAFEDGEYVTVGGRRAYAVSTTEWEGVLELVDFDDTLAAAVKEAHTRQAKLLFDSAVESTQFDSGTVGVVIGVDTAEEMV